MKPFREELDWYLSKELHYLCLFQILFAETFSNNFNEFCLGVFMQRISAPNSGLEQPSALAVSWKDLAGIPVTLIKTQK